jgi:hypothetical protein
MSGIHSAFPELANVEVTFREGPDGGPDYSHLQECDVGIATF